MYARIGAVLKRLREERGMSLEEVAGAIGYPKGGDPSGLQRMESGGKRVYADLYWQVARAYGVPLADIIREAEGGEDRREKVLSPQERETVSRYLAMSNTAKYHVDFLVESTAKADGKP